MKNIYLVLMFGVAALFASCSNKVDFGEQYKKAVYIINSKELTYNASHDISTASAGRISIYVTGSELPKSDIRVSYRIDSEALQKYNEREYGEKTQLYFSLIPENLYAFSENEVVIAKGEPYGCLHFTINTEALISSKTYILPITLVAAEGAEVSESQHTILYVIRVQNEYAGEYISTYKENGAAKGTSIKKKIESLSARKVLIPIGNKSNMATKPLTEATDFYQVTINDDQSLVIEPYLSSVIEQNSDKKSYYDPAERIFYIYYKMKDDRGGDLSVEEVIKMI